MNRARWQGGFSLVEVMCAILILGLALVGLTQGLTTALSSSKEAEVQTAAALLAAGQIELLRADEYLADGDTDGDCEGDLAQYRWRQNVASTSIEGLHEVQVTIEKADTGKPIYELRTLLFEPPASTTLDNSNTRNTSDQSRKWRRNGL